MDTMNSEREMIKCEKCGEKVVFDEELVEEIDGKVYCKKCAQDIKNE